MSYFNTEFVQFFKELSRNNNTEWFNNHRKVYEKEVKKPFADFVELMISRIQKLDPKVQIKPSDAIMRINRDIRFSKDKRPYNEHVAANISAYGKKDKSYPGFYFQLSADQIQIYGGAYMIEKEPLQKLRQYIADHLSQFQAIYQDSNFKAKFGEIQGEQHKRLPAEFQAIQENEPLIANKQFYYAAELDPELITSAGLIDRLMDYCSAGLNLNAFLTQAMALK